MLLPLFRPWFIAGATLLVLAVSLTDAFAALRDPNRSIPPQVIPAAKNRSPEERTKAVEQALEKALTVHWEEMAFRELIQQLSAALQVPIVLDPEGLDEAGVTTDQLVTLEFEDVRAEALLDVLLGPLHLEYEVRRGMLVITSEEKAAEHLETRVYNVRDLLAHSTAAATPAPAKTEPAAEPASFFGFRSPTISNRKPSWWIRLTENDAPPAKEMTPAESLVDAITGTIAVDTWTSAGGAGSLRVHGDLLIVSQDGRTLQQVESLLRDMRKAHAAGIGPAEQK